MGLQLTFALDCGEFPMRRLSEKVQVARSSPCMPFRNVWGVSNRKPVCFRHGWIQGLTVSKVLSSSVSGVGSGLDTLPGLHLALQPPWTECSCPLGPPAGVPRLALVVPTWGRGHLSVSHCGLGDTKL